MKGTLGANRRCLLQSSVPGCNQLVRTFRVQITSYLLDLCISVLSTLQQETSDARMAFQRRDIYLGQCPTLSGAWFFVFTNFAQGIMEIWSKGSLCTKLLGICLPPVLSFQDACRGLQVQRHCRFLWRKSCSGTLAGLPWAPSSRNNTEIRYPGICQGKLIVQCLPGCGFKYVNGH